MSEHFIASDNKKVEYIELIYDLIFVYLVGRNNALPHTIENGFFTAPTYATYIVATLVILQVWYFSSLFINRKIFCLREMMFLLSPTSMSWSRKAISPLPVMSSIPESISTPNI